MASFESFSMRVPRMVGDPRDISAQDDVARNVLSDLFDAEFVAVYRFLLARCGSPSIAEDVASETFVEAARIAQQGRVSELSKAWLFVVARRRLVDCWRADERHRRRIDRLRARRDPDYTKELVEDERVLSALQSLPTRQRTAVTLRYLDEYSVAEIAEVLEVTYRAAESLLSRGRANFTKAYGEHHA